jgi:hypothetical protein
MKWRCALLAAAFLVPSACPNHTTRAAGKRMIVIADSPHLWDLTATILGQFGVPAANGMIGQTVF